METKSLLKKCLVVLALFFGLIGMTNLNAQEFTVGDLNYRINDDGVSVTVTGHVDGQSATGELNIPESVTYNDNDYLVTIIGDWAFSSCANISGSLIIPNTVIIIGEHAFYSCTGFNGTLTIGNSVTTIGESAFAGCHYFTGSIIIPNSVIEICNNAFINCSGFDGTLVFGDSVGIIGAYAFYSCFGLHGTLSFGHSVTTIGWGAFERCYGFNGTIIIPSSVVSISSNPFSCWNQLESIIVEEANEMYDSRNNCNAIIETGSNELITGCKNTIIPDEITSIGHAAFSGCYDLSGNLIIPNTVTTIGDDAFLLCYNLSGSLTIPNSVTSIGYQAFWGCEGFDGILTIGSAVNSIGENAFSNCTNFCEAVSLATTPPELGDEWGHEVFVNFGCTNLTVPCGCIQAYESSLWHEQFTTIIEDCSDVAELDENLASVYPNPTSSIVKIEAENIQNISIYNLLGKLMLESAASGDTFEYDFSNNESGVYIVRIETAKGVVTKRVTVM